MLRQWNYREHYHPNITESERPHWDIHAGEYQVISVNHPRHVLIDV